jgi:Tfp pilus assembly protein PilF
LNGKMKVTALLVIVGLVVGMSGCGFINKLRAKNSLNEGVRAFNGGHYDQAQDLFADALKYNPDNSDAQLFYARAINARFEQKQTEELGLKALDAYQNIINRNQNNPKSVDQALAFEAKTYEDLANAIPEKAQ